MIDVTNLVTRPILDAHASREELVRHAREDIAAFGIDLEFDDLEWIITEHCPRPAGSCAQKAALLFATHEDRHEKRSQLREPLPEPFGSVVKAIVRIKKDGNPKLTASPLEAIVRASRSLFLTLEDRGFDPCRLVPQDFERACDIIEGRGGTASTHYRLGQALEQISVYLAQFHVTVFAFTWKNRFPRVANISRVGSHAEEAALRVPSEEVLDEIARLSHLVTEPSDRLNMAAVKLFHCAPWRVGELNTLSDESWVEEQARDGNGLMFDAEGRAVMRYGIRYWQEKTRKVDIKWIPSAMAPIARSAFDDLLELTQEARDLARWYEDHLGRAWLPGPDLGPDQRYTPTEVERMFGLAEGGGMQWLRGHKLQLNNSTQPFTVRRQDLEQVLLAAWTELEYLVRDGRKLKRSQHLFLVHLHFHHAVRHTNPCILTMTTDQHIRNFLSGRGEGNNRVRSVFERFGSVTSDGQTMRVNTHAFRHWLNTLVQRGGLSQVLVARWSGRKDIAQNSEYDHMTGTELGERGRDLMVAGKVHGILADIHDQLPVVEQKHFRDNVFATAHVTEIGMCDADFIASPCPELGSCSTCEHCHIKKGDQAARARAQTIRDDTAWLLDRAIAEANDNTFGASNYVEAHRQRQEGLDRILAIHDNPNIPNGTWVRPNAESLDHFAGEPLKGGS